MLLKRMTSDDVWTFRVMVVSFLMSAITLPVSVAAKGNGVAASPAATASVKSTAATTPTTEIIHLRATVERQAAELEQLQRVADGLDFDRATAALRAEWLRAPRQKRHAIFQSIINVTKELAK